MEILDNILQNLATLLSGISLSAIIGVIFTSLIKKFISKVDVNKISENAVDKGIDKIKSISFTQSIEPIAKAELEKITEKANAYIENALKEVNDKYNKLIIVMEKLCKYFDDSLLATEEKKKELYQAIENAKTETIPQEIETAIIIEDTEETNKNTPILIKR